MLLEEQMLHKKIWAVIGANQNPEKYGNMIYRKLKRQGYTVYAVNPMYQEIEGDHCYGTLKDLPQKPDVLNMVVSPAIGIGFLQEAKELGIKNIWLQPGTYDEPVMKLIKQLRLTAVQACVLVAARKPFSNSTTGR